MEDFEKNIDAVEEAAAEAVAETAEEAVETPAVDIEETEIDADQAISEEFSAAPVKKKTKVQTPIIIAACVLIAAIIAGAIFIIFFNNSVVGTWVEESSASADEANGGDGSALRYYTFEQDGTAKISLGSMDVVGTWNYAEDDTSSDDQTNKKISVAISYFFNGTFDIDIKGNALTGKKLILNGYGSEINFIRKTKPEPDIKVPDEFKSGSAVEGKWKNEEQNVTYTFNSDGTCVLNQMDMLIIGGTYSVDEEASTVTITYVDEKENALSIEYQLKDEETVTFSGLEYKKVTD